MICRVTDGGDVLLLFSGSQGRVRSVDMIMYDHVRGRYVITLPGYRYPDRYEPTMKPIDLNLADNGDIHWEEPGRFLGDTQVTLSEKNGVLRETTTVKSTSGQTSVYEATMNRRADGNCVPTSPR